MSAPLKEMSITDPIFNFGLSSTVEDGELVPPHEHPSAMEVGMSELRVRLAVPNRNTLGGKRDRPDRSLDSDYLCAPTGETRGHTGRIQSEVGSPLGVP